MVMKPVSATTDSRDPEPAAADRNRRREFVVLQE
jgi:hypothetical protein